MARAGRDPDGLRGRGHRAGQPFAIEEPGSPTAAVLGGWVVVYFVVAILVVADAVRLARRRDLDALQRSANFVKLIAVPFFLLNFIALTGAVAIIGADDADRLGLDGFLMALLFVVLAYLVFLPTSAYGVACLVLMRKDDRIGRIFFGVNLTLHFLFVVDVISAIVVVEVARHLLGVARRPGAVSRNLLSGVLFVGSALALVWFACVAIFYLGGRTSTFFGEGIVFLGYVTPSAFVLLVLIPVVPLVTFRTAVRQFLAADLEALRGSTRTVKLALIPLFLQNFALCALIVLASTYLPILATLGRILLWGPSGIAVVGAFTTASLVPTVVGTYLMLLPTSIPGVTCLALMMRRRVISPRFFAVNLLLQLVFVADIISALVVASRAQHVLDGDLHQTVDLERSLPTSTM